MRASTAFASKARRGSPAGWPATDRHPHPPRRRVPGHPSARAARPRAARQLVARQRVARRLGGAAPLVRVDHPASRAPAAWASIPAVSDAIGQLFQNVINALTPILIPDWTALVDLLPILLVIGVVGPILSLIGLGWFDLRRSASPATRLTYVEPEPRPARIVDGAAGLPARRAVLPDARLIYPFGVTRARRTAATSPSSARSAAPAGPRSSTRAAPAVSS